MPRPDIEAIQDRVEASTQGDWFAVRESIGGGWMIDHETENTLMYTYNSSEQAANNARFAASAHQDVAALLAYIAELEPIARAVANNGWRDVPGYHSCWFCPDFDADVPHAADCPVMRARALFLPPTQKSPDPGVS